MISTLHPCWRVKLEPDAGVVLGENQVMLKAGRETLLVGGSPWHSVDLLGPRQGMDAMRSRYTYLSF